MNKTFESIVVSGKPALAHGAYGHKMQNIAGRFHIFARRGCLRFLPGRVFAPVFQARAMVAMRVEHRDRPKAHCALESVAPVVITSSRSRTLLRPSAPIARNLPCMLAILSCRLKVLWSAALHSSSVCAHGRPVMREKLCATSAMWSNPLLRRALVVAGM